MRILRRLAQWMRFRAHSAELEEELAFHRDAIERDLIARGQSPADARDAARRAMGHETLRREEARGIWLWPWLEAVFQDARVTLRGLRGSPAFTAGVMLTFALGVGANAAMFSLIDRLMLRPPAFLRDPASVHRVYLYRLREGAEREASGRYPRQADLERFTTSFSSIAHYSLRQLAVGVGQEAREMPVGVVSGSFFSFFDAPPAAGRYYGPAEDRPPAGAPVAVLSYATWQTRYAGRSEATGSTVQIGSAVYTIIGVAPRDFAGLWPLTPPAAFIPVAAYAASAGSANWPTNYGWAFDLRTIVRRRAGVTIEAADADLTQALQASYLAEGSPDGRPADRVARLRPRAQAASILEQRGPERSSVATVALWLAGVTIAVLLIACANVASLLLARALARRREIAVRLALGVSQSRLLAQLFTESLLLATAGSLLGLAAGTWMSGLLRASFLPGTAPAALATDPRTLGFIGILTLALALFTGVLPMLQARRLTLTDDLKSGARSGTHHRVRARAALLVLQGALSLVLLVGAGLFVRSMNHVRAVRLGFDADSVLVVETEMRDMVLDSAGTVALRQRLLAAAVTLPEISHATFQLATPMDGATNWPIAVPGIDSVGRFGDFEFNAVSPDYFATMGTRILRGRGFERGDVDGAEPVIVVGAAMGATLWPGQEALGKCVRVGLQPDTRPCRRVVGIAENIQARGIGPETRAFFYYLPAAQWRPHVGGLFARARGDARLTVELLRRRLQAEMPGAAYVTVSRLGAVVEDRTRSWLMGATLFTVFGLMALVLAAGGLYSVIAYDVAQRRQELAVRVALGAGARDLVRLVVGQGLRFAVSGAVVGGVIALIGARWIAPLLFNQSPRDPAVFGAVTAVLLVVSAGASCIPATRCAKVDPNAALRAE